MPEPTLSNFVTIKIRRGNRANLPATAPEGELLLAKDTKELFFGTGTGVQQIGTSNEHKTVYTMYEDTSLVYADGLQGLADPKGREGWYFANPGAGGKINWYFYDPSVFTTTVANLQNAYAIATLDTSAVPFLSVYTLPTGTGDATAWYKSARVFTATSAVVPGKYLIYFGTNPSVYPNLPRIQLTENTAFVAGGYSPTETVNLIAYHTDSSSAANTYKFVTHQLGFTTIAVNQEFNLKIKGDYTKTYTQSVAAATWTINHNSNRFPSVTTVDNSGAVIEGAVTYLNANQLTVQFSPAVAGKAYLN